MKNIDWRNALARMRPWLYLSAGAWGALIAYFSTLAFWKFLDLGLVLSFAAGLTLNSVFNFWFTWTYHSAVSDGSNPYKPEVSYLSFFAIHALLCSIGLFAVDPISHFFGARPEIAILVVLLVLSLLSLFVGRIWIFVSPHDARVAYEELQGDFYESSGDAESVGSFRAWYHNGRFEETRARVEKVYQPGFTLYDFGSGGSEWNRCRLPVIGIDTNESLLKHGAAAGQLCSYKVCKLEETGLPDSCADVVVITEVLEHIISPQRVLSEIRRVLKPGGILILSVPWDTIFSPFFWLFNAQCFYRGYLLGEKYYIARCGHVNHFSKQRLKRLLTEEGFMVNTVARYRGLLLYSTSTRL
jgi:2-polyprenyl-3-methyl-5-hydroxy-6-metoxy-1,4-benzoquinol methylase